MRKMEQIQDELRRELRTGLHEPGTRFESEYGLAARFGVNKTTVNKAVATLVQEGYLVRGARGAGTLVASQMPFKGDLLMICSILHPSFAALVAGAQAAAANKGYRLVLAAPPPLRLHEDLPRLYRSGIAGVLTSTYQHLYHEPEHCPIVYVGWEFDTTPVPARMVNSNSRRGVRLATEAFLTRGHRHLVYYGSHRATVRIEGFRDACADRELPTENRVFTHDLSRTTALNVLKSILRARPKPTGIVTGSDDDAYRIIQAGLKLGVRIPGDLSISGFGNLPTISGLFDLTSVEQHAADQGFHACEILVDIIDGRRKEKTFNELTEVELVHRGSIADLSGGHAADRSRPR